MHNDAKPNSILISSHLQRLVLATAVVAFAGLACCGLSSQAHAANPGLSSAAMIAATTTVGQVAAAPGTLSSPAMASSTGFVERTFRDATGDHKYVVFVPRGYTPSKKWPVILFLHGAGERGRDGFLQTTVGLGPLVKLREASFPFITIFPQAERVTGRILDTWSADAADGQRAISILDEVQSKYTVDRSTTVLAGYSMGGWGAWNLAAAHPDRFSAMVTVAGGGDPASAAALSKIPVWAIHGARDTAVLSSKTVAMVDAHRAAGGPSRLTISPTGDHGIWKTAFDDEALYDWMRNPSAAPANDSPVLAASKTVLTTVTRNPLGKQLPFHPQLDVPNAIYLRLGNDVLAAVAASAPATVPADLLRGGLQDIYETTSAEGVSFNVRFSGISYSAQLVGVGIRAAGSDRLSISLAMSNVQISIAGIYMDGGPRSASAGLTSVVLGHVRPVVLAFDVKPTIVDRKIRLVPSSVSFSIPADNFYVTAPQGVSVRGLGVTSAKVSSGIVSGLYGSRARIESQIQSIIPSLIPELEKRLDLSQGDALLASIWPLPGYQPRIRTWPAEIATDADGVSLVLGVTVASLDPYTVPKWYIVPAIGPGLKQVPKSKLLEIGVNPSVISPLTKMLAQAGVASIDVLDTPSEKLAQMASRNWLSEVVPDLKLRGSDVAVSTELRLASGIQLTPDGEKVSFRIPDAQIIVSISEDPKQPAFKPYVIVDLDLTQSIAADFRQSTGTARFLDLKWDEKFSASATAKFAAGVQATNTEINTEQFREVFLAGWKEFTSAGSAVRSQLPDIDLGIAKLRAIDARYEMPFIAAKYGPAGIIINNRSDSPLVYQTRSLESAWGPEITLAPGKSHRFMVATAMGFRHKRAAGKLDEFTLPAGSNSDYRIGASRTEATLYAAPEPVDLLPTNSETAAANAAPAAVNETALEGS